jgi:hypothetical protein
MLLVNDSTGQLARERIADLHRQAQHRCLARLARHRGPGGHRRPGLRRRLVGWLPRSDAGVTDPSTSPSAAPTSARP